LAATRMPQWHGVPIRVRAVPPDDVWLDPKSLTRGFSGVSPLVESEVRLPATERAQVLSFDLPSLFPLGNAVDPVVTWATHYRSFLPPQEVPASLVAIGKGVPAKQRRLLREKEVYFIDESRQSVQRLMGGPPRSQQILRLIQNLCGVSIPPQVDPYNMVATTVANPGLLPPPGATTPDWDAYTKRPQHIDPKEVETLFNWLSKKPEG
jgi:hypothetical protein